MRRTFIVALTVAALARPAPAEAFMPLPLLVAIPTATGIGAYIGWITGAKIGIAAAGTAINGAVPMAAAGAIMSFGLTASLLVAAKTLLPPTAGAAAISTVGASLAAAGAFMVAAASAVHWDKIRSAMSSGWRWTAEQLDGARRSMSKTAAGAVHWTKKATKALIR